MSIQLNKYPLLAVEKTSLWRMYEIVSEKRAALSGSTTTRLYRSSAIKEFKVPVWVRKAERTFRQSPLQEDSPNRG